MPITVKTQVLLNSFDSLVKIDELCGLTAKRAKKLRKAITAVKFAVTEHYEIVKKLAKQYADLDDIGEPVSDPKTGQYKFTDTKKKVKFYDEVKGLSEEEEEINLGKIPMSLFDDVVIPSVYFSVCEWLFEETPDSEDED